LNIKVALYRTEKDNQPQVTEMPWAKLALELTRHDRTPCAPCPAARTPKEDCPHKYGPAWSPVEIEPGSKRGNAGVRALTLAVFDLDAVSRDRMAEVAKRIDGVQYIAHSTHSPNSYRLVFALSRSVKAGEWPKVHSQILRKFDLPADPATKDLARIYFFPTAPEGAPVVATAADGVPLDVDEIIRDAIREGDKDLAGAVTDIARAVALDHESAKLQAEIFKQQSEQTTDLEKIRMSLRRLQKAEHKEVIQRLLRGEPLADPGARDRTVNQIASLIATAPPSVPAHSAAMVLLEPSIRAMQTDPEGLGFWLDKASKSFNRAVKRRVENDARRELERRDLLSVLGIEEDGGEGFKGPASSDWRSGLIYAKDKDGDVTGLVQCVANAELILRCDDRWAGTLRYNEVTKEIDVIGGPLERVPPASREIEAAAWLQRSEYRLHRHPNEIGLVLLAVARRSSYDPLADYLNSLAWDQTPRIDNWLQTYFGAEGDPEYLKSVGSKWLISAVARALNPGCKVDTVLILEGAQGRGKSTGFAALAGEYGTDTKLIIGDKDSRMLASQAWIIEMAELASWRQADSETLKSFLSARDDLFRPPYGRVLERTRRRCVFVGTTNSNDYLHDPTGHRRYWPVKIRAGAVEKLASDRDQIWAEAVVRYKAGEQWWLDPKEEIRANAATSERESGNPRSEVILDWWLRTPIERRPEQLMTADVAVQALGMLPAALTRAVQMEIGTALASLGFLRIRVRRAGAAVWVYRPSELLRTAPNQPARALSVVEPEEVAS
jgi:predicted P-loop ATPase